MLRRHPLPVALAVGFATVLLLVAVGPRAVEEGSIGALMLDPAIWLEGPYWTGYLSNLGIVVWLTGAVCAVFAGLLLRGSVPGRAAFLIAGGLFTAALALDDLFLVHEELFGNFGVPQSLAVGAYAVAATAIVLLWRAELRESPAWVLAVGFALLGASLMIDQLVDAGLGLPEALHEDVPKLMGIVAWSIYWCAYAFSSVTDVLRGPLVGVRGTHAPRAAGPSDAAAAAESPAGPGGSITA